jgi:hypothetical protein
VGVIADARTESLADTAAPQIYCSVNQRPFTTVTIFLRGQLNPSAIPAQVREQVRSIDPELPVFHAVTLHDALSASLSVRRFSMEMVACFAATALLLAGLGIYGTLSYVVNEQRREIAIRLALGAQRSNILSMILRQGLGLAAAGAGPGVAGALIVSHLIPVCPSSLASPFSLPLSRSPPATSRRYAPCASIQSLHSTPNDFLALLEATRRRAVRPFLALLEGSPKCLEHQTLIVVSVRNSLAIKIFEQRDGIFSGQAGDLLEACDIDSMAAEFAYLGA